MEVAALALWVLTAIGGSTMAGIWLANRGPTQHRDGTSRISPTRLGTHAALAATGLALWVVSVITDNKAPGWVAAALLTIVAALGFLMFMTWLASRSTEASRQTPAERHIPPVVVAAHGLFAMLTVLAVLAALIA